MLIELLITVTSDQVGPRAYNLVLNCDANTRGHTQWFLFRVKNMVAGAGASSITFIT